MQTDSFFVKIKTVLAEKQFLIKCTNANRSNNPEAVFADTVNLTLSNYSYRSQPLTAARLDSVNADKLYQIYQERFADASAFTFVFTGSIDTATFIPLVAQYLGALPAAGKKEFAKDLGTQIPEGQISKTVYKGNDNKASVRLLYSGNYHFSRENNIQLSALGAILQYRMIDRIRELEGGAYTPQAGVSYNKLPRNRYAVSIQFTCAPGSVDKLVTAANEEIEKIKTGGVTAEDVAKFTAEQTRSTETQMQTNQFWRGYITYALQNNEPVTGALHFNDLLKTVTPQTVQQAAKQYINSKNYIRLVLMPEPQK